MFGQLTMRQFSSSCYRVRSCIAWNSVQYSAILSESECSRPSSRSEQRIDGKHAALSWKNRRDCIPHSPLSPHLRKTTGRAGPWQLMAANVGDMYFHCNMKICCCFLLYCFYRWLLFSQFATYNALQLTSIHQFNWNIGRRGLQFCCFLRWCRCRYFSNLISR